MMTPQTAKEKLHQIIDHADDKEVFTLLSLIEGIEKKEYSYDDDTLNILRERNAEYLTGKSKTYTPEESLEQIRVHRKKNGI